MARELTIERLFARLAHALAPSDLDVPARRQLKARVLEQARASAPADTHTLRMGEGCWEAVAAGVSRKVLRIDAAAGTHTFLLRMAAGSRVEAHEHMQAEECFVVSGEMWIGNHRLGAGDMHVAQPGSWHAPARSSKGALLLIRSAFPAP